MPQLAFRPRPVGPQTPDPSHSDHPRSDAPADLVHRCAEDRASAAWDVLVERYGRCVEHGVHLALDRFGLSPEPALVEDLTQEAYCRLVEGGGRRLRTFRGTVPAELAAWLRRIAEHTALDHLRAAAAAKRGGDRVVGESAVAQDREDPVACPQTRIEDRERLRHFARRCRALTEGEENARILKLVLVGGWTSRDVARASRGTVSPSRVDSLVYRLRRRLKEEGLNLAVRGLDRSRSAVRIGV